MDNGSPWGAHKDGRGSYTEFAVWLIRLGVKVSHSRPHHPQTQGKDERFHRTLGLELLRDQTWRDLDHCQKEFDRWRDVYNNERPHEALLLKVPAERYQPSERPYPERLPDIEYSPGDIVRKVQAGGQIKYQNRRFFIGQGFRGLNIALRPTTEEGQFEIYFCQQRIGELYQTDGTSP